MTFKSLCLPTPACLSNLSHASDVLLCPALHLVPFTAFACFIPGGAGSVAVQGTLSWPLLLLQSTDSRARGHWALGHRLSSCRDTGSVAPRRMGSSRIRDQSRASCLGRWTPYHWATREALRPMSSSVQHRTPTNWLAFFPYMRRVSGASHASGPLRDCLFFMRSRCSGLRPSALQLASPSYPATSPYLSFSEPLTRSVNWYVYFLVHCQFLLPECLWRLCLVPCISSVPKSEHNSESTFNIYLIPEWVIVRNLV